MTEKQTKQVAVQKAVVAVMDKNQAKWNSIPELRKKVEEIMQNLTRIKEFENKIKVDLGSLKAARLHSRKVLVEQVFPVASVLGVFACDMEDKKLRKLGAVKFSELEKMGGVDLVKYCIRVLKTSGFLLGGEQEGKKTPRRMISDYGLTKGHLDKLKVALDAYIASEAAFNDSRVEKKKSKIKMDRTIRENNQLLKKKMDRMMHLFRESEKPFYDTYIQSRIVAKVVAHEKEKTIPVPAKKSAATVKKTASGVKKQAAVKAPPDKTMPTA